MKLKLEDLAPYLPYKLKVSSLHTLNAETGIGNINHIVRAVNEGKKQYKPILRPIHDFFRYEEYLKCLKNLKSYKKWNQGANKEIGIEYFINSVRIEHLEYWILSFMFENHFDVFGLIDKGLAIDINTIKP